MYLRSVTLQTHTYLSATLEVKGEDEFAFPGLTLPHQEMAMPTLSMLQNEMSRVHTRKQAVKPWKLLQVALYILQHILIHHCNTEC